ERAHPASCVKGALLKDEYLRTIEQAGFQNVSIIKETHHSFEDAISDPNARVIVADPETETEERKSISELNEEAKEMVKKILTATMSINVSATKPME
ncbi:MAG: hypothetical protein NWF11_07700, partial [Candidatus Bathyarchaeota archaeon]|nr:hypothetical protein [Candidatus Bathyarchaeota archaeon]